MVRSPQGAPSTRGRRWSVIFSTSARALEGKRNCRQAFFVGVLFCIGGHGLYGTVRYGRGSVVRIGNRVWCMNGIGRYLSEFVRIWLNLVEFVRIWPNSPFVGCFGWFGANPGRSLQALSAPVSGNESVSCRNFGFPCEFQNHDVVRTLPGEGPWKGRTVTECFLVLLQVF